MCIKETKNHFAIDYIRIPNIKGFIGISECPGLNHEVENDISAILQMAPKVIISLMQIEEYKLYGMKHLPHIIPKSITYHSLPIRDGSIPDQIWESQWSSIKPLIHQVLIEGSSIFVHCVGGRGRSGTIAARILVEFGMTAQVAIDTVRDSRQGAIENVEQEAYIRGLKI